MSDSFGWEDMAPALTAQESASAAATHDGLAQALIRLDAGVGTDSLLAGLPDDQCQCAHWGYVVSGTMRVTPTKQGHTDYEAGRLYY